MNDLKTFFHDSPHFAVVSQEEINRANEALLFVEMVKDRLGPEVAAWARRNEHKPKPKYSPDDVVPGMIVQVNNLNGIYRVTDVFSDHYCLKYAGTYKKESCRPYRAPGIIQLPYEHDGSSECPVDGDVEVLTLNRNGRIFSGRAWGDTWQHVKRWGFHVEVSDG